MRRAPEVPALQQSAQASTRSRVEGRIRGERAPEAITAHVQQQHQGRRLGAFHPVPHAVAWPGPVAPHPSSPAQASSTRCAAGERAGGGGRVEEDGGGHGQRRSQLTTAWSDWHWRTRAAQS